MRYIERCVFYTSGALILLFLQGTGLCSFVRAEPVLSKEYQAFVDKNSSQLADWQTLDCTYLYRTFFPLNSKEFFQGVDVANCNSQIQEGRIRLKFNREMLYIQYIKDISYAVCEDGTTKSLEQFVTSEVHIWVTGPEKAFRVNKVSKSDPIGFVTLTTGTKAVRYDAVVASAIPAEILHLLGIVPLRQVQHLNGHSAVRFNDVENTLTTNVIKLVDRFPVIASLGIDAPKPRVDSIVEQSIIIDTQLAKPLEVGLKQFIGASKKEVEVAKTVYSYDIIEGLPIAKTVTVHTSEGSQVVPTIWLLLGNNTKFNEKVEIPPVPTVKTVVDERKPRV